MAGGRGAGEVSDDFAASGFGDRYCQAVHAAGADCFARRKIDQNDLPV